VSLSVLVLGNQPAYRKKLHDTFAGNAQFEVLDISGREEDLRADSMAFHSVQLVAFGGSLDCEQWELIQKVRNRNHLLPVLVVAKGKDKSVQDTEMLLRSLSPTQSSADLLSLAKKCVTTLLNCRSIKWQAHRAAPWVALRETFFSH
jgi:hypothetical protein